MRVALELPDWTEEKTSLFLAGGREVVARKVGDGPWQVKTGRCSRCGACCRTMDEDDDLYDPEKGCKYLLEEPDGTTACAHPSQPWSCVRGSGESLPECTVKYEVVDWPA